jgi:hypothetical protein
MLGALGAAGFGAGSVGLIATGAALMSVASVDCGSGLAAAAFSKASARLNKPLPAGGIKTGAGAAAGFTGGGVTAGKVAAGAADVLVALAGGLASLGIGGAAGAFGFLGERFLAMALLVRASFRFAKDNLKLDLATRQPKQKIIASQIKSQLWDEIICAPDSRDLLIACA